MKFGRGSSEEVGRGVKRQWLLVGMPRKTTEEDLANILRESMENW